MRLIENWGRRSLIAQSGRRDGGQVGRMGGAIDLINSGGWTRTRLPVDFCEPPTSHVCEERINFSISKIVCGDMPFLHSIWRQNW